MGENSGGSNVISLPEGGGALSGIGEKFSPDLHTGTGNFTVPIALPPGRNGFQPELSLVYSSGNGTGAFGLGWSLSIPGVARQTSKGVPRYDDARDTFVLSGAEDLVPIRTTGEETTYHPRTEGLFARIRHVRNAATNHWRVESKDGLRSWYGTPEEPPDSGPDWRDPAALADPRNPSRVFAWKLTETRDPFGNRVLYDYDRDLVAGEESDERSWDQLYLRRIRYADYTAADQTEQFLISVSFEYEELPDRYATDTSAEQRLYPFSDYRAGFEIRTRRRCTRILVRTHPDDPDPRVREEGVLVRSYQLTYLDQRADEVLPSLLPHNGVSLLSRITVAGHDERQPEPEQQTETLPPLEFGYSSFEPEEREFFPLEGQLPARSLASPDLEMADLFGNGLPDILEMNGTVRYWRNLGAGEFDLPRPMPQAPAGLALADPDVQLIDADGDGRIDLLVTSAAISGYFPTRPDGTWDRRSFRRYRKVPSFSLQAPDVRLVDLDGDGVTDAIRSGTHFECFFNDPQEGWNRTRRVPRRRIDAFPNVDFSDSRVRWADMSGDGLQDIVLVHDGNVEYWPALGYGDWGRRIHMHDSPRFPYGYDPRRILVGDVDGDGLADIVYVDDRKVLLWINQSGNGWSDPVEIDGTPPVTDMDAVRLVDVLGTGVSGVLWSTDAHGLGRPQMFFLDFTGGVKPYLLNEMNNHMGAVTRAEYAPSTRFYLEDQKDTKTRWQTPLPFPVQVVARVEVVDELSGGKLTTEYRPHHGYWDGAEREFRGFGMVEQLDTETFENYSTPGLHGDISFTGVDEVHFSPPTLTKTWFHQGPIGEEFGDWFEADYSGEFWSGDPPLLERPLAMVDFLKSLPRRVKRDALRALRGSVLRTELYALDGTEPQDRPYTVTESVHGLCGVLDDENGSHLLCGASDLPSEWTTDDVVRRVFFPHPLAQRTTQWERGDEPMTQFGFTYDYDSYGQPRSQISIAVPRWRGLDLVPKSTLPSDGLPGDTPEPLREHAVALEKYLATHTVTDYAQRDDPSAYIVDRVARVTTFEVENDGTEGLFALLDGIAGGTVAGGVIGQALHYYDGDAFVGLPFGEIGEHGALVRSESLVLTAAIVEEAYPQGQLPPDAEGRPAYLESDAPGGMPGYPPAFRDALPARAGYRFHGGAGEHAEGWFAITERRRYDVQDGSGTRGLQTAARDPLGGDDGARDTTIEYDPFRLLPTRVTNPAGLTTEAEYDYRVLQPAVVTDANGNRTTVAFSPLGLLRETWAAGNPERTEGDRQRPGTRLEYDFLAYINSPPEDRQPVFVRTIRHTHHDTETDVPLPERDETIETVEYSDGFGRLLQTRTQAEDVRFGDPVFGDGVLPADQADAQGTAAAVAGQQAAPGATHVAVSGWKTYDNKGRVVEQYEPFFGEGWAYLSRAEAEATAPELFGRKVSMVYDPRGQVVRTVNPDGSEQRIVYGVPVALSTPEQFDPTPWEAYTYDASDNAGRTHPLGGQAYDHHWDTPSSIELDALGRTARLVERNRGPRPGPAASLPPVEEYVTLSILDIRGNAVDVIDALERRAFHHVYDLADRPLRVESIDAGTRRLVLDAAGAEIERRDGKGALVLQAYDVLGRPVRRWGRDGTVGVVTLREYIIYGDSAESGVPLEQAIYGNLRGRPFRHHDEAGRFTLDAYDFKGNPLERVRQVIGDAAILSVFDSPPPDWQVQSFGVDWQPTEGTTLEAHAAALLDPLEYRVSTTYDALNRIREATYPEDVEGRRRVLRPRYNRAGALERVSLDGQVFVEHVAYDAKGQRALAAYGNGVMIRYAYDPLTSRLTRLRSERYTAPAPYTYAPTGAPLQDLGYGYDLAGNILALRDRTPDSGIPNTVLGTDALDRAFEYDALHRLRFATGREHATPPPEPPWSDVVRTQDPTLTRAYTQRYGYDAAGNLGHMQHQAEGGSFTRHFAVETASNRLQSMTVGQSVYPYDYDACGNLVREGTSRHFEWDQGDRLKVFRTQVEGSEPSVHAHYLYDAGGQRVKKLVRKQGGAVEVTVYLGLFEHHRVVQNGTSLENDTLHVMDDRSRVATVRVGPAFPDDATPALQYHLGDHLGSGAVVIDQGGAWINREEFTPYGETSFGGFAHKRYRFTGKERDDESGLNYHGARYYAPWLGRWSGADPAGTVDGTNLYIYVSSNPPRLIDSSGTQEHAPPPPEPTVEMVPDPDNPQREIPNITVVGMIIEASPDPGAGANSEETSALEAERHSCQYFSDERVREIITYYTNEAREKGAETRQEQLEVALSWIKEERNKTPNAGKDLNYAAADHYLNMRAALQDLGPLAEPIAHIVMYSYDLAKWVTLPLGINVNVFDENAQMPSEPDERVRDWAIQGMMEGRRDWFAERRIDPLPPIEFHRPLP